jgi:hypothetical protein
MFSDVIAWVMLQAQNVAEPLHAGYIPLKGVWAHQTASGKAA